MPAENALLQALTDFLQDFLRRPRPADDSVLVNVLQSPLVVLELALPMRDDLC